MVAHFELGPEYDDYFLLRFLRARKFDVNASYTMFDNFMNWRRDEDVDNVRSFAYPEVQAIKESYPHGYHNVDKQGRPIWIERIGKLNLKQLYEATTEERQLRYFVREYERMILERLPAASEAMGHRVEQGLAIIDLAGASMKLANS